MFILTPAAAQPIRRPPKPVALPSWPCAWPPRKMPLAKCSTAWTLTTRKKNT
jgi:hypothetical protein